MIDQNQPLSEYVCFPNIVIMGSQKTGTTALHSFLMLHPQIRWPNRKELHIFDIDRNYDSFVKGHFHSTGLTPSIKAADVPSKITIEATPSYTAAHMSCQRMKTHLSPDARYIVILRNPTKRVWSELMMKRRRILTQEMFKQTLIDNFDAIRNCLSPNKAKGVQGEFVRCLPPEVSSHPKFPSFVQHVRRFDNPGKPVRNVPPSPASRRRATDPLDRAGQPEAPVLRGANPENPFPFLQGGLQNERVAVDPRRNGMPPSRRLDTAQQPELPPSATTTTTPPPQQQEQQHEATEASRGKTIVVSDAAGNASSLQPQELKVMTVNRPCFVDQPAFIKCLSEAGPMGRIFGEHDVDHKIVFQEIAQMRNGTCPYDECRPLHAAPNQEECLGCGCKCFPKPRMMSDISRNFVWRSMYRAHLAHCFQHLPRERVLVIDHKELEDDMPRIMAQVSAFSGLDAFDWSKTTNEMAEAAFDKAYPGFKNNTGWGGAAVSITKKTNITSEMRASLNAFFHPDVEAIRQLSGLALAGWP